jgi:TolB protein
MLRMLAMNHAVRTCALAFGVVAAFAASVRADTGGTTQQLGGGAGTLQDTPAISGSGVVWTNYDGAHFDIYYQDVAAVGATPQNLTASLDGDQFLEDINSGSVVFTNTAPNAVASDILLADVASGAITNVAAGSTMANFARPSVARDWIVFERITTQVDIDIYDRNVGGSPGFQITTDAAAQRRPRVAGNVVVYEDYNLNPNVASVAACQIGLAGCTTLVVDNVGREPDVDADNVVYIGSDGSSDQVYLYNLTAKTKRQLTTVASAKSTPRISGNRVVWTDARGGDKDIYSFDVATGTETALVATRGLDESTGDIDGNRLVYSNANGNVFVYTYPGAAPSDLPLGCDPSRTDLVVAPQTLTQLTKRPVYASGAFVSQAGRTYYLCVDNGKPDGSQRGSQILAAVDNGVVLSPGDFMPQKDPPKHVATKLTLTLDRRGRDASAGSQHAFDVALFSQPISTITVSIRVAK